MLHRNSPLASIYSPSEEVLVLTDSKGPAPKSLMAWSTISYCVKALRSLKRTLRSDVSYRSVSVQLYEFCDASTFPV